MTGTAPGPSEPRIRRARHDDLDRIVLFNRALARETEGRELDRSVVRRGVEAVLEDPSLGVYWLAELPDASGKTRRDGSPEPGAQSASGEMQPAGGETPPALEVAGQLLVTVEWSDWRNAPVWWIQSVYVSRTHRGGGVYSTLHDHVRHEARESGAAGIRLYVDRDNRPAHEVYRALGLQPAPYVMFQEMWR